MAGIAFDRPVGAAADVQELEYIAALHQTHPTQLRGNASIQAQDIVHFLSSKYGVKVASENVKNQILSSFSSTCAAAASGETNMEDFFLDIPELVSLLLIPQLAELAAFQRETNHLKDKTTRDNNDDNNDDNYDKDRPLCPRLVETVLGMILMDATESRNPKQLNKVLLQDLLASHGETELAHNDQVVEEMLQIASGHCGKGGGESSQHLTKNVLLTALTSDLKDFSDTFCGNDDKMETVVDSVFGSSPHQQTNLHDEEKSATMETTAAKESTDPHDMENGWSVPKEKTTTTNNPGIQFRYTAPFIDYTAVTIRSQPFAVILWVFAMLSFFAYLYNVQDVADAQWDCTNHAVPFGCMVARSLKSWVILLLELSILGTAFISLSSMGNSLRSTPLWATVLSIGTIGACAVLPYRYEVEGFFFKTTKYDSGVYTVIYNLTLFIGAMLVVIRLLQALQQWAPRRWHPEQEMQQRPRLQRACLTCVTPGALQTSVQVAQAAKFKLKGMISNAHDMHDSDAATPLPSRVRIAASPTRRALENFAKVSLQTERVGGILWTWRRIFQRSLFCQDGITLNTFIVAGNAAQVVIFVLLATLAGSLLHDSLRGDNDNGNSSPTDSLVNAKQDVLTTVKETANDRLTEGGNGSVLQDNELVSIDTDVVANQLVDDSEEHAPEPWMIFVSIAVGTCFGLMVLIYTMLTYLPSAVSTTLKFRSGIIPSLGDEQFLEYRLAEDRVTILLGSIFWGAIFATGGVGLFFGLFTFAFVWRETRETALMILANIIALLITIFARQGVMLLIRRRYFAGFFRSTNPAFSNFLFVLMTCWNIGLSTGYMLARCAKVTLISAIYLGRVDTPLFAPGVARMGPVIGELDGYPIAFRQTLLMTDAHCHPYMEVLGKIYLLKLKHTDGDACFATRGGNAWRLLFVLSLMPWLRKYRVISANPSCPNVRTRAARRTSAWDLDDFQMLGTYRQLPPAPRKRASGNDDDDDDDDNNHHGESDDVV